MPIFEILEYIIRKMSLFPTIQHYFRMMLLDPSSMYFMNRKHETLKHWPYFGVCSIIFELLVQIKNTRLLSEIVENVIRKIVHELIKTQINLWKHLKVKRNQSQYLNGEGVFCSYILQVICLYLKIYFESDDVLCMKILPKTLLKLIIPLKGTWFLTSASISSYKNCFLKTESA